jgi:glycosyltransferase involved in cell wall biosynthesis
MFDLSQLSISFLAGTLGQGGAERQLFYTLKALKQGGAKLRLFCLTRGEFWEGPLLDLGIPITWIGRHQSRLARLAQLMIELRRNMPVIIQSQHFYTNIYAAMAARVFDLHEIGALRNDCFSEVESIGRILGSVSLRMPRFIAANSQAAIQKAIEMGLTGHRLHLFRNTVDTDYFAPGLPAESRTVRIAAIGRLVKQKRFDKLLSMLARIQAQSHQPFKVLIAGDGPLRSQLETQAARLGLQNAVEFKGAVADSREIYHQADLFVLTSDWEGLPNVVLEAMACGLPVVATRVGDLTELIRENETGFLADPEDEVKWVAALLKLLHNPSLRKELGHRSRQYVVARHSPQQLPQRLQNLYEAVLA